MPMASYSFASPTTVDVACASMKRTSRADRPAASSDLRMHSARPSADGA